MTFRWISLALIAAILAAEGYLLFNRYLYGPLNVIDWSARVMTSEEKENLFQETREELKSEADAATDVEFASIVRSALDPLTVCGMARLKSTSGVWGSWVTFNILFPGHHPVLKATIQTPSFMGMGIAIGGQRVVYQIHNRDREITPHDRFTCEPVTCEKCDRYLWVGITKIDE